MYKASSYFALGENNCHMQIGCHKAYAVRDGTRGCGCGFDENPPVGKPAGLEKTRPQVDPRVHFYTRTRTRGFRAGFGCPRV
jgi:hypothetical protein